MKQQNRLSVFYGHGDELKFVQMNIMSSSGTKKKQ